MESLIAVNADIAKDYIIRCMKNNLTCFIQSEPGIGKSSIVKEIANEFNFELIDVRLSTCDVTDLSGLPHFTNDGKAYFAPFNCFPIEDTPLPEGKKAWILFLDEFNGANRAVQLASYKLVLDRQVGQFKLHPKCFIVCAGNRAEDRAITNEIGTAMRSRLVHINMKVDFNIWFKNVAMRHTYDPRIIAFLQAYPTKLMVFEPESENQTFPCPRTWQMVNSLIKNEKDLNKIFNLIAGTIGMGTTSDFLAFIEIMNEVPTYEDIINNPNIEPPKQLSYQWASLCLVLEHIKKEDIKKVLNYINKFPKSMIAMFIKYLCKKDITYAMEPEISQQLINLSQYLQKYE